MADAIKSTGTTIHISSEVGSPQAFVLIGNVVDFNGPNGQRKIIDSSHLGTTGAATKLGGMLDEGDFNFTVNYDPSLSSHQLLETARQDGSAREVKITLTDSGNAEIHFNAIVKSFPRNGPFDDKVTGTLGLEITGSSWITY